MQGLIKYGRKYSKYEHCCTFRLAILQQVTGRRISDYKDRIIDNVYLSGYLDASYRRERVNSESTKDRKINTIFSSINEAHFTRDSQCPPSKMAFLDTFRFSDTSLPSIWSYHAVHNLAHDPRTCTVVDRCPEWQKQHNRSFLPLFMSHTRSTCDWVSLGWLKPSCAFQLLFAVIPSSLKIW